MNESPSSSLSPKSSHSSFESSSSSTKLVYSHEKDENNTDYVGQARHVLEDAVDPEHVFLEFQRQAEEHLRYMREVDVSHVSKEALQAAAEEADKRLDRAESERRNAMHNVRRAHQDVAKNISRALSYVKEVWRMWKQETEKRYRDKRKEIKQRFEDVQRIFIKILEQWKENRRREHGRTVILDTKKVFNKGKGNRGAFINNILGIDRRVALLSLHKVIGLRNKVPYGRYYLRVSIQEHLGGPRISSWRCTQMKQHSGAYDDQTLVFQDSISLPSVYWFQAYTVYVFELVMEKNDVVQAWGAFPALSVELWRMKGYAVVPLLRGAVDPYINFFHQYHDVYANNLDRWVANLYFTVHKHVKPTSGATSRHLDKVLLEEETDVDDENKNKEEKKENPRNTLLEASHEKDETDAIYSVDIEGKEFDAMWNTKRRIKHNNTKVKKKSEKGNESTPGIGPEMRFLLRAIMRDMGITTAFTAVMRMMAVIVIGMWSGSMMYGLCLWTVLAMAGVPGVYPSWHPFHIHLHFPRLSLYVDLMLCWTSPLLQQVLISSVLLIISAVHRAEHGLSAHVSRVALAVHITWCFAAPLSHVISCAWSVGSCESILPYRMYHTVNSRPVEQFWIVVLVMLVYISIIGVGFAVAHLFLMWGYMGGMMGDIYKRLHTRRHDAVPQDMSLSLAELRWVIKQFSRQDMERRVVVYQYECFPKGNKKEEKENKTENIQYVFRIVAYEDGSVARQIIVFLSRFKPHAVEVLSDQEALELISAHFMVPVNNLEKTDITKSTSTNGIGLETEEMDI